MDGVLNIYETTVADDGILERSDVMYILDRIKRFMSDEDVVNIATAEQSIVLIKRRICKYLCSVVASLTESRIS